MANKAPGQTLQPTALVHEAWLRLAGSRSRDYVDQTHFFATAAEAMRRILIERARRKASLRRGGNQPLEVLHESQIEIHAPSDELLAVNETLD
jgi:RNA polymerase sigma factor (TIGR02999 family)